MQGISEKDKNRLLAAADVVDKGEVAIVAKIYEFLGVLDDFKAEWEAMKAELGETLPSELQTKFDTLSSEIEAKKGEIDQMLTKCEECMESMEKTGKEEMQTMSASLLGKLDEFRTSLLGQINEVKGLIPEMPDAFDPTDILNRINEIEAKIPKEVDLSGMEGDIQVIKDDIEEIKKDIEELKKRPSGGRSFFGGGFNYSAMNIHIIDDETPSGTIDGNNTVFTIANLPNPISSLKVYLNGQRMRITEDYTLSGGTITFVTAPSTGSILLVDYRT